PVAPRLVAQRLEARRRDLRHRALGRLERLAAEPREREQLVDQGAHPRRFRTDDVELALRLRIELRAVIGPQELGKAADGAQRGAQIVRNRVAEPLELLVGRLELRRTGLDAMLELDVKRLQ